MGTVNGFRSVGVLCRLLDLGIALRHGKVSEEELPIASPETSPESVSIVGLDGQGNRRRLELRTLSGRQAYKGTI